MFGQLRSVLDHNGPSLRVVCIGGSNIIMIDDKFLGEIKESETDGSQSESLVPVRQHIRLETTGSHSGLMKAAWFTFGLAFGFLSALAVYGVYFK